MAIRTARPTQDPSVARQAPATGLFDRWCLSRIVAAFEGTPVHVQLWDGTALSLSDLPPVATILIHDRPTLVSLVRHPEVAFFEAYTGERIEVLGDLEGLLESVARMMVSHHPPGTWRRPWHLTGASTDAARHNIHEHYDLGNDFYRLWLDETMTYTCAYFTRPEAGLEEAQRAKLDHICRKLHLRPGDRVIEAGCGWGTLALHMARHYGVTVQAYNISSEQLAFARDRAEREHLGDRVTFLDADYRDIDGSCDAFVSIGMLEHVGSRQFRTLGSVINRVLDPIGGRGLLHFIGRNYPSPINPWIERHIFPGAYVPVLSEVMQDVFEAWNLSVTDVENLRLHYAQTLQLWLERFDLKAAEVRAMFDDQFVRMWRMYLISTQAGFRGGDLQLFQIAFARAANNALPLTRAALYADGAPTHGSL